MSAPIDVPPIVERAFGVSRKAGYVGFCRNETGRLLAALAATRTGTIAEFGTGCGVGTAWLRSGAPEGVRLLTAELNATLAAAAAEIFAEDDSVEVMTADWSTLRGHAPFSLLFMDAEEGASLTVNEVVDLVAPGGIVVLDDLTPCQSWPPVVDGRVDLVREQWLDDERFVASEVMVAPDASVVIATRR